MFVGFRYCSSCCRHYAKSMSELSCHAGGRSYQSGTENKRRLNISLSCRLQQELTSNTRTTTDTLSSPVWDFTLRNDSSIVSATRRKMDMMGSVESIFGFNDNSSIDPQLLNDHTLPGAENDNFTRQMSEDYNMFSATSITSVPNQQWQPFISSEGMPPPAPHYQEQMMRHRRSFSQPPEDVKQATPSPPMVFHRSGQLLGESTSHAVPNPAMDDLRRRLLRDRQANNASRNRRGRSRPYPDPRAPRTTRSSLRHSATKPCIPDTDDSDRFPWQSPQLAPTHAAPVPTPAAARIEPAAALQTIINRLTIIAKASDETKGFLQRYLSLPVSTSNTMSSTVVASELEA